jgi:uncharacterized membrane protein
MKAKNPTPSVSSASTQDKSSEPGLDQIGQNIEAILAFYAREEQKMSGSQRVLEIASGFAGRPLFLGCVLFVVALWILANVWVHW